MLVGVNMKPTSVTEEILIKMCKSSLQFFLTGSRFFGWEKPDSDWDFFTQTSPRTAEVLRAFGLREDTSQSYQDGLTRKVFVGHSVHVQLVTSVTIKQQLNEFFFGNKRLLATPKFDDLTLTVSRLCWTPGLKSEQKVAWQTAVAMFLSRTS